jgi:hypothetical protein
VEYKPLATSQLVEASDARRSSEEQGYRNSQSSTLSLNGLTISNWSIVRAEVHKPDVETANVAWLPSTGKGASSWAFILSAELGTVSADTNPLKEGYDNHVAAAFPSGLFICVQSWSLTFSISQIHAIMEVRISRYTMVDALSASGDSLVNRANRRWYDTSVGGQSKKFYI